MQYTCMLTYRVLIASYARTIVPERFFSSKVVIALNISIQYYPGIWITAYDVAGALRYPNRAKIWKYKIGMSIIVTSLDSH